MRIPKWFEEWYNEYGIMDDYLPFGGAYHRAQRIAWRAYRKGRKDYKKELREEKK